MFGSYSNDHNQTDEQSGFEEHQDGVLDHLADVDDRAEVDLFDNDFDAVPDFAPPLAPSEQELVDKMQTTISNAQARARQQQTWDQESLNVLEQRLEATVQSLQPSLADDATRHRVLQDVNSLVELGLAGYYGMHVAPYGSFVSGLYTSNGDIDISIEGVRTMGTEAIPCSDLDKEEKIQLLKALGSRLTRSGTVKGHVERILHARVPIIKFKHTATGIDCDVSVSSTNARFKSTVLRHLSSIDPRMAAMVQLVKLWAGAHGMNDATAGTFNSFALTLMVVFHLQNQEPAILPPLCDLFRRSPDALKGRPLHAGREGQQQVLDYCGLLAATDYQGYGSGNDATLTELLASFFVLYYTAIKRWSIERTTGLRCVRMSTWCGEWTYRAWTKRYCVGIEDPFDCTDNCGRTIAPHASNRVANAFGDAMRSMDRINSATVSSDKQDDGPSSVMQLLFTKPPPRANRGQAGVRARGRGRQANGPVRYLPIPNMAEQEQSLETNSYQQPVQAPPGLMQNQPSFQFGPSLSGPPPPPPQRSESGQLPYSLQAGAQGIVQQPQSSQPAPPPGLQKRFVYSQQLGVQSVPSGSGELQYGQVQILNARQPTQEQNLNLNGDAGLQTVGSSGWDHDLSSFNSAAGTADAYPRPQPRPRRSQHAHQGAGSRFENAGSEGPAQHAQQQADNRSESAGNGEPAQHAQQADPLSEILGLMSLQDRCHRQQPYASSSRDHVQQELSSGYYHPADSQYQRGQADTHSRGVVLTDRPKLGPPLGHPSDPAGHNGRQQHAPSAQRAQHAGFDQGHEVNGWDTPSDPPRIVPDPRYDPSSSQAQSTSSWDAGPQHDRHEMHAGQSMTHNTQQQQQQQQPATRSLPQRASQGSVLTVPRHPYNAYPHLGQSVDAVDDDQRGYGRSVANHDNGNTDDTAAPEGESQEVPHQSNSSKKKERNKEYWKSRARRGRGRGRGRQQQAAVM